jgi:hypothetical protein
LDSFEADDDDYDDDDYEDLRECQYTVIVNIYSSLYFSKENKNMDIELIADFFNMEYGPYYNEKLNKFLKDVDFDDPKSYRLSEVKFVVVDMQILLRNIKKWADASYDMQLSRSRYSANVMQLVEQCRSFADILDKKVFELIEKMKAWNEENIQDFVKALISEDGDENDEDACSNMVTPPTSWGG